MDFDEIFDKIDVAYKKKPLLSKDICKHSNTGNIKGTTVCTSCGLEISHSPVYVRSYNRVFSYRRQPIYSRQKRFYQYVLSFENNDVGRHMDEILCMFAMIEFYWNIFGNPVRKYFFNRNVTFFFIADFLNLSITPKTLKDENRVNEQIRDIKKLLDKNNLFK